jgi:hypothetical protein
MPACMTRLGYRFAPDDAPIWVASDTPLEPHARRFWHGWPFAADSRALDCPDIVLEALPARLVERFTDPRDDWGGGFRLSHASIDGGFMDCANPEEAANQLAGVLVALRVRATPGGIAAHAASCETPAGVVVLPGASMSGKSTLSLQLMLLGGRLFGDDRLLLDAPKATATALGLTPRLRLPVPADAGAALARLASEHGTADPGIAYLDLAPDQAAAFGDSARIAAFVAPERLAAGPARLDKASASSIVRALLGGAVTGEAASAATLAAVAGLAARTPCWSLRWSNSAEAGALLWRQFGGGGSAGSEHASA